VGLAAGAGAVLLGRDLWLRGGAAGFSDLVYYAVVGSAGVPALQAQWALYERADRLALLPLPIAPDAHFADAVRITLARTCPLALVLVGLAVGSLAGGAPPARAAAAVLQVVLSLAAAVLAGIGIASIAGRTAMRTDHAAWQRLRETLAGGWAAPEHAPFFWAPGLAVGLAAVTASGVRQGAAPAAIALGACLALAVAGRPAFRQALFQVAPLAHEHARSLYGGERPPPLSPLGLSIGHLLPARARPFFVRDAIQLARISRGRGVLAALGIAAIAIAALRTDAAPWVTSVAAGLVGLMATGALRVARPDASPPWMERALPAPVSAMFLGRAGATALLPGAIGIAAALALVLGGASGARLAFVAALAIPLALVAAGLARIRAAGATWAFGAVVATAAVAGGMVP
jgi:hypothetical protein